MLQAAKTPALPPDLARRMMRSIQRIACSLVRRLPSHVAKDDLIGAGCQGLATALGRFDATHGASFEAYAEMRIRGAMLDELRRSDPLSRDQRGHVKQITAASRALCVKLGRPPTPEEIAATLGISLDVYWERLAETTLGVTTSFEGDEEHDPSAQAADGEVVAADEYLVQKEQLRSLDRAIAALPPRARRVLELHYTEGLTLKQIGEQLGVSESRVCQIETETVRRIRALCPEHAPPRPAPRQRARAAALV